MFHPPRFNLAHVGAPRARFRRSRTTIQCSVSSARAVAAARRQAPGTSTPSSTGDSRRSLGFECRPRAARRRRRGSCASGDRGAPHRIRGATELRHKLHRGRSARAPGAQARKGDRSSMVADGRVACRSGFAFGRATRERDPGSAHRQGLDPVRRDLLRRSRRPPCGKGVYVRPPFPAVRADSGARFETVTATWSRAHLCCQRATRLVRAA